jgi:leader peptidase (prepilin peptidase)/N-methyltransferase
MPLGAFGAFEPTLTGWPGHVFAAVLGALFGSFANVCIVRWPPTDEHPDGRSVVKPGSHCPRCGAAIRWYDNVPIVSYFALRGRCRACRAEFSGRYAFVEAATAMLFVAVYHLEVGLLYPADLLPLRLARFAIAAAFVFVLVVISFIDLDTKLILNRITYPAIPIFYGLGMLLPERSWHHGLVGAAVGYGVIRLVADGYYLLTRRRGLGYGDGKLLALVGAYLGWQAVVASLFLGSMLGTVIGGAALAWSRARERRSVVVAGAPDGEDAPKLRHVEIPFGPFLAAAALAYLFLEPWLRLRFFPFYR